MDKNTTIHELKNEIKVFCEERDWDKFHNAKDLSIGIVNEASELLELFRFKSEHEVNEMFKTDSKKQEINDEMADVLIFLIRLAEKYDIDLTKAVIEKIKKNGERYPIEKVKGCNKKYTEYEK